MRCKACNSRQSDVLWRWLLGGLNGGGAVEKNELFFLIFV